MKRRERLINCQPAEAGKEQAADSGVRGKARLEQTESGLTLTDGKLSLTGEFKAMLPRLKKSNLEKELLVKAARIKGERKELTVVDATAGMGEDSLLLAAAGFRVALYELDPTIAALLRDSLNRAKEDPSLCHIVSRMTFFEGDSMQALRSGALHPDLVYLDPMFPERQKSAMIGKKFQLLQQLERPCDNGAELFEAALAAEPRRIIVKRPLKGQILGNRKPDFSYEGKAIRYDCYTFAR